MYTLSVLNIFAVIDVRDLAQAHVLAIGEPPSKIGHERLLFDGSSFLWYDGVEYLHETPSAMRLPSSDIRRRWTIKGYDVG